MEEALDQHEGDHQHQEECQNRGRVVLPGMVHVPVGDHVVEGLVLNVPATVAKVPHGGGGSLLFGQRRGPPPVTLDDFLLPLALDPLALPARLEAADHTQRAVQRVPREEAFFVSELTVPVFELPGLGQLRDKDTLGILEQFPAFVLENDHDVFARVPDLLDKRGLGI